MKHLFFLITIRCIVSISPAQYILIEPASLTHSDFLNDKQSNYKILNLNCMSSQYNENFLIHFVVFSDSNGSFKKNLVVNSQLKSMKPLPVDSIILKAKINTQIDQQREITHFEYEGDYNTYPIKSSGYKVAIKNNDSSFTVYENYTLTFFYQIKAFKQFVSAQSCASLINTQSIPEPTKRIYKNDYWEIDFPDTSYSDYFPNKLFLEKVNNDSTYHFVRYRQLCMDCSDNYNFEFDYDRLKGITQFWYYIPKILGDRRNYIKFSSSQLTE